MGASDQASVEALLDAGLAAIDDRIQREFDGGCAAPARIAQLTSLRGQYVFDRMRLVRAGIAADDGSAAQAEAIRALDGACTALARLQDQAARTDGWIDQVSDALAKVASLAARLAAVG